MALVIGADGYELLDKLCYDASARHFLALPAVEILRQIWIQHSYRCTGNGTWQHYILPGFTLGWFITAGATRLVRSSMLEVLDTEYVKLARAKGVAEAMVVWKHALRNALIPVVTFIGFMFGVVIASSITTETVFVWPGIGRLVFEALLARDFPVIQGIVLIWSGIIIFLNLLVDLAYGVLDPRIRS